jgi:hypothetical protein
MLQERAGGLRFLMIDGFGETNADEWPVRVASLAMASAAAGSMRRTDARKAGGSGWPGV